jgi:hypothetical protein
MVMSEKRTAVVADLEAAYAYLKQMPLIKWCSEKRVQLENDTHIEPPKGILTAEQAAATTKTSNESSSDAEFAAALKGMA